MADPVQSSPDIEDLLPCPFCGSAPVTERTGFSGRAMYVYCINDNGCPRPKAIGETVEKAVENWNLRAPHTRCSAASVEAAKAQELEDDAFRGGLSKEAFDWAMSEAGAIDAYKTANPDWEKQLKPARDLIARSSAVIEQPKVWHIIDHEQSEFRPHTAAEEAISLSNRIRDIGPEVVASILLNYAKAYPSQGSFAGSLWAIAEWVATHLHGVAQPPQVPCPVCGGEAIHAIDVLKRTIIRAPIAWDANENRSYEPVETLAAEIYDGFVYDGPAGTTKPKWTPGGNGIKQDEARFEARRRLRESGHTPAETST